VAAVPSKRLAPAETRFLERDEIEDLLRHLPRDDRSLCGTGPSCSSCTTPEHVLRRAPICALNTSISVTTHSSACTARATSAGRAHSGTRRPRF
jgi:hypothetical protein